MHKLWRIIDRTEASSVPKYRSRWSIDHAKTLTLPKHRPQRCIDQTEPCTAPKRRPHRTIDHAEASTAPKHRPSRRIYTLMHRPCETSTAEKHRQTKHRLRWNIDRGKTLAVTKHRPWQKIDCMDCPKESTAQKLPPCRSINHAEALTMPRIDRAEASTTPKHRPCRSIHRAEASTTRKHQHGPPNNEISLVPTYYRKYFFKIKTHWWKAIPMWSLWKEFFPKS